MITTRPGRGNRDDWASYDTTAAPQLWDTSARLAPAIAPAILAAGGGSYGVLYTVAGLCAIIGAAAILPVHRVR